MLTCVNIYYVTVLFSFRSLESPQKGPNPTLCVFKKKRKTPGGNLKSQSQGVQTSHTNTAVYDHWLFV